MPYEESVYVCVCARARVSDFPAAVLTFSIKMCVCACVFTYQWMLDVGSNARTKAADYFPHMPYNTDLIAHAACEGCTPRSSGGEHRRENTTSDDRPRHSRSGALVLISSPYL